MVFPSGNLKARILLLMTDSTIDDLLSISEEDWQKSVLDRFAMQQHLLTIQVLHEWNLRRRVDEIINDHSWLESVQDKVSTRSDITANSIAQDMVNICQHLPDNFVNTNSIVSAQPRVHKN